MRHAPRSGVLGRADMPAYLRVLRPWLAARAACHPPWPPSGQAPNRVLPVPVNRHRLWQVAVDAVLIVAAWRLAFFLRFDRVRGNYIELLSWRVFALVVVIKLSVFVVSGFYTRWWRYVSTRDMWGAVRGVTAASAL